MNDGCLPDATKDCKDAVIDRFDTCWNIANDKKLKHCMGFQKDGTFENEDFSVFLKEGKNTEILQGQQLLYELQRSTSNCKSTRK